MKQLFILQAIMTCIFFSKSEVFAKKNQPPPKNAQIYYSHFQNHQLLKESWLEAFTKAINSGKSADEINSIFSKKSNIKTRSSSSAANPKPGRLYSLKTKGQVIIREGLSVHVLGIVSAYPNLVLTYDTKPFVFHMTNSKRLKSDLESWSNHRAPASETASLDTWNHQYFTLIASAITKAQAQGFGTLIGQALIGSVVNGVANIYQQNDSLPRETRLSSLATMRDTSNKINNVYKELQEATSQFDRYVGEEKLQSPRVVDQSREATQADLRYKEIFGPVLKRLETHLIESKTTVLQACQGSDRTQEDRSFLKGQLYSSQSPLPVNMIRGSNGDTDTLEVRIGDNLQYKYRSSMQPNAKKKINKLEICSNGQCDKNQEAFEGLLPESVVSHLQTEIIQKFGPITTVLPPGKIENIEQILTNFRNQCEQDMRTKTDTAIAESVKSTENLRRDEINSRISYQAVIRDLEARNLDTQSFEMNCPPEMVTKTLRDFWWTDQLKTYKSFDSTTSRSAPTNVNALGDSLGAYFPSPAEYCTGEVARFLDRNQQNINDTKRSEVKPNLPKNCSEGLGSQITHATDLKTTYSQLMNDLNYYNQVINDDSKINDAYHRVVASYINLSVELNNKSGDSSPELLKLKASIIKDLKATETKINSINKEVVRVAELVTISDLHYSCCLNQQCAKEFDQILSDGKVPTVNGNGRR